MARSTQAYKATRQDDDGLRLALIRLAKHYRRYGYRKIAVLLRIEGWKVNHKKVERLWRGEGLQLPQRHKRKKRLYHKVAEAAVVGYPHDIKGQGIYAYVTLMEGIDDSEKLHDELKQWVRKEIGPIATPDLLQWAPGLPKTRSGKIMRRILRKIAENEPDNLGDISTLADPAVVEGLVKSRMNT